MVLASEAMQSLNKAENTINKTNMVKQPAKKPVEQKELPKQAADLLRLKQFIDNHNLGFQRKDGRKYVKVEAWQYLAQIKNLMPTFETEPHWVELGEERVYTVETTCILKLGGTEEVSRSTMVACSNEKFLKDKPMYAVWGLSETRAFARAVKNIYGYLLVSLGFQAVPFEEMDFED